MLNSTNIIIKHKLGLLNLAEELGPAYGQARTSNELRKRGIFVYASGVRSIWLRNNLENFKKRLKILEEKINKEGSILSEDRIVALKKSMKD